MVESPAPAQPPADDHGRGEDRALLARIASKDRVALELLYRRHAGWLTGRLQSRCGAPEMVDLAVQDTFLAVWNTAARHRGDGEVGAWLWGIGIRRLIDLLRKRHAVPVDPELITAELIRSAPPADTLEDVVLGDGSHGDLAGALGHLPAELRAVLVVTAIDGLSTREAARLLGVPQGTVKTRLARARRHLQEELS